MANIIILGPPGAGKGTLSEYLENKYGFLHLSTGNVLRKEFHDNPKYREIKKEMDAGDLVPDDIVNKIVEDYIDNNDTSKGIVFDGFPRDKDQLKSLEKILKKRKLSIDFIIDIEVSEKLLIERICGRYTCGSCGAVYHEKFKPSKHKGVCDVCGSEFLFKRIEDSEEVMKERMKEYIEKTSPIIKYYEEKGKLQKIYSGEKLEESYKQLDAII